MAHTQCLQCTGTFDDSNRFCPGCGFPSFTQATVATNTGGLPPEAQTQSDRTVTVRDLIDNVLDLFDSLREYSFFIIMLSPVALIMFPILFAVIIGPSYSAADRAAEAQYQARHAAQMDQYMMTGRFTPQEAKEAIERNDAVINYWLDR